MNSQHPPTADDEPPGLDVQIRQWLDLQRGQWQAIADTAGVSHSWLSKFARGLIPNPGYPGLLRLERCRLEGFDTAATLPRKHVRVGRRRGQVLQERYPVPRQKGHGQHHTSKAREALSLTEAEWNVEQLRKAAHTRLRHADALEAWNEARRAPVAAVAMDPREVERPTA